MIFKDLLLAHTDEEILLRVTELFPDWVKEEDKDYSEDIIKYLKLLRKKKITDHDNNYGSGKLFVCKYENPWDLPEDEGFELYQYDIFMYDTDSKDGTKQVPYGIPGIAPLFYEIYPPSLELVSKLDFICYTMLVTGLYGEQLLDYPAYDGDETYGEDYTDEYPDDDDNDDDSPKFISYEELKAEIFAEIDEECKRTPGLREELDRREERENRLLDKFYEDRAKLMSDIDKYYKKR